MKAIFNSSPLIFLAKLGVLEESLKFFDEAYIPLEVKEELFKKEDEVKEIVLKLIENGRLKEVKHKNMNLFDSLNRKLGRGESSVIVITLENFCDSGIAILDDYTARKQAMSLGIRVKGTLGILRRLYSKELDIDELYEKLKEIGFRVKWEVFVKILKG